MSTSYEPYLNIQAIDSSLLSRLPVAASVAANSQPYQYTRLKDNQIRLLRISVEPVTGNLVCSFEVREIETSRGAYRAISYCWGNATSTTRVLCSNGQFLSITKSAAEILQYVVPHYPSDLFWIDQLCINQADLIEKSTQVLMMGQIYSSTKQVIAWLGRGDKGIATAISNLWRGCMEKLRLWSAREYSLRWYRW